MQLVGCMEGGLKEEMICSTIYISSYKTLGAGSFHPTAEHGCRNSDVALQLPRMETLSRYSEVLILMTWCYAGSDPLKSPGPIAESSHLVSQFDRVVVLTKICMELLVIF